MIDWRFIASLEGADVLTGYVPNPEGSRSGVTIASGVDLGHILRSELAQLPADLQAILAPYVGKVGAAAMQALKSAPLRISEDQAKALDAVAESAIAGPLRVSYNAYGGIGQFEKLPDRAQTVICSVAYQYGTNLAGRCPRFWGACVRRDWQAVISELHAFDDDYESRHLKEAAYLRPILDV